MYPGFVSTYGMKNSNCDPVYDKKTLTLYIEHRKTSTNPSLMDAKTIKFSSWLTDYLGQKDCKASCKIFISVNTFSIQNGEDHTHQP